MVITCSIPTKRYLKKFVYWKENLQDDDILDLNSAGEIPWVLGGLLTGKLTVRDRDRELPEDYDDMLTFRINPKRFRENKIHITTDNVRYFNSYLHKNFHETLLNLVVINLNHQIAEVDTIYTFMSQLEIEDDITHDALKKASYRLRNSKNIPHFRSPKRLAR